MALLLRQAVAVIDSRTTVICLHVSGEIVGVDEPFDTLNGSYDDPPFHTHCRTIEVPWMAGFINDARTAANAELQNRPLAERDTRNFRGIPGPDNGPSAPLRPGGPDVGGGWTPKGGVPVKPMVERRPPEPWSFMTPNKTESEKILRAAAARLTPDQMDALDFYTTALYEDVNPALRRGAVLDAETQKTVDSLKAAIDAQNPSTSMLRVYRGLSNDVFGDAGLQSGDVFVERGFLSTALDIKSANYFKRDGGVLVTIEVPQGTKFVNTVYALNPKASTAFSAESELVLAPGTKMQIVDRVVGNTGQVQYRVRVVNDG